MGVFGWANMDRDARSDVKSEWCERLWQYSVSEIQGACREHSAAVAKSGKAATLNAEIIRAIIIRGHAKQVAALGGNVRGPAEVPEDETPEQVNARRKSQRLMDDPAGLKRTQDFVSMTFPEITRNTKRGETQ